MQPEVDLGFRWGPLNSVLLVAGVALLVAGYLYLFNVGLADRIKDRFGVVYRILDKKYGFDEFNQAVFAGGSRAIGRALWQGGDRAVIDGVIVDGSAFGKTRNDLVDFLANEARVRAIVQYRDVSRDPLQYSALVERR